MTDNKTMIKSILGLVDDEQNDVLDNIIALIQTRLQARLNGREDVPKELNYIVIEASISRFNRINDEGKTSTSESEVSASYQTDDLAPFAQDIADWLSANDPTETKGKFVMY